MSILYCILGADTALARRLTRVAILLMLITACSNDDAKLLVADDRLADIAPSQPSTEVDIFPASSSEPPLLSFGSRSLITAASDSALGPEILACVVNAREGQGCSFLSLPLIGMETANPTIDTIMSRVVVSHEWMRTRFREILGQMPPEILLLMRSLSAIVISYDIRPSFYYPYTGAIYLDPDGMWLSEAEESVIDTTPDYRSEFGSQLQFTMLWRYVLGNTDIRSFSRDLQQVSMKTAALLFHELAHATDFYSPAGFSTVDRNIAPVDTIFSVESDGLTGTYPLSSDVMRAFAQVSFRGVAATDWQKSQTADDIANEFSADTANDNYNYLTQYEDMAVAFEEAMMYHGFDISRDVAVTNFPTTNTCDDYIVAWGQRNRIGDPSVQARSMYAVRALLPEVAGQVEASLAAMPAPTQMAVGINWCDNISLSSPNQRLLEVPFNAVRTVELLNPYH